MPIPVYNAQDDASCRLGQLPMDEAEPHIARHARTFMGVLWVLDAAQYAPWAVALFVYAPWWRAALLAVPFWAPYVVRLAYLGTALCTIRSHFAVCAELTAPSLFPLRRALTLIGGEPSLHVWSLAIVWQTALLLPLLALHAILGRDSALLWYDGWLQVALVVLSWAEMWALRYYGFAWPTDRAVRALARKRPSLVAGMGLATESQNGPGAP